MNKILTALAFLLISSAAMALPDRTWTWVDPINYVDGTVIPVGDVSTVLSCGFNTGGPYTISQPMTTASPSVEDMAFIVQNIPGTYFCVSTSVSAQYGTESDISNEASFLVSPTEIGKVPQPPTLLSVQ